jgi:rSAM/selenodomain-associated transferase 1
LRDTLEAVSRLDDVSVRLMFAPRSAEEKLRTFMQEQQWTQPWSLLRQRGRTLGARLEAAFDDAFEEGATRVIAIGTDSPSLPVESIDSGFNLLSHHECVLGPTLDGGYYLIGLSRRCPDVFHDIQWSESTVYRDTVAQIERAPLNYRELPVWYDVDTSEDLEFLIRDINQFRISGDEERVRHTESVLLKILKVET